MPNVNLHRISCRLVNWTESNSYHDRLGDIERLHQYDPNKYKIINIKLYIYIIYKIVY